MPLTVDLDPRAVRLQFDRRARAGNGSAPCVSGADYLLREAERRMFERLDPIRVDPEAVIDLGCGLGSGTTRLAQRFPSARVIGVDGSAAMAREAARLHGAGSRRGLGAWLAWAIGTRGRRARARAPAFVATDAHRIALADGSVDLVWSNLAWHWFADPVAAVAQCRRVLRPGGLLVFSALGVDTFAELREAGAAIAPFPDLHDLGDALVSGGFADPVLDAERITVSWASPERLLAEVRALGGDARPGRRRGLAGRETQDRWHAAIAALAGADGRIVLTFEIVYVHGWRAAPRRASEGFAPVAFVPRRGGPAPSG